MNNEEKKEIQKQLLLTGATDYTSDFFDTSEYNTLKHTAMDYLDKLNDERLKFKHLPMSTVLKAGKFVIDKHTRGISLKVPYTNCDFLRTDVIAKFGEEPKKYQYDEIVKFIDENAERLDVTDIPVHCDMSNNDNGFASSTFFFGTNSVIPSFYEKLNYYVSRIELSGACDENKQMVYVHELYHALLGRNKGSINNLLHNEALSIFMEKVAALDLDDSKHLLDLSTLDRLLDIKTNIMSKIKNEFYDDDYLATISKEKYIISTLLATALFDTYEQGTSATQRNIDNAINKVLIGDGQLEDVFDKYEATEEKGSILVRKQMKEFHTNKR